MSSGKNVIIISKCIKEIKSKQIHPRTFEFHFKGVLGGDILNKIHLTHIRPIEPGVEYLIYAEILALENGKLLGKVTRIKPLDECWDRS